MSTEQELLQVEKAFWTAIQNEDVDSAMKLTDATSVVTGAQGVSVIDRETFGKMMRNDKWKLHRFDLENPTVRFLTDDVAVVAYKVKEDVTVDGERMQLEAADASAWVRRNGEWKCGLHTESLLGDSFGRDRRKVEAAG